MAYTEQGGSAGGRKAGRGMRVLIIEDDEVSAEILQSFVRHHDAEAQTTWAWNGYEALIAIKDFAPDLILLDYMMPRFDGLDFLKTMRTLDGARDAYIAVISAFVDKAKEREFFQAGASVVLSKPIDPAQVRAVMEKTGVAKKPVRSRPAPPKASAKTAAKKKAAPKRTA
ncbi:MAG: response regulator [Deltaproteobacteria bacterium]|nr:response regulator [Deltaproteobacteria bacterium]